MKTVIIAGMKVMIITVFFFFNRLKQLRIHSDKTRCKATAAERSLFTSAKKQIFRGEARREGKGCPIHWAPGKELPISEKVKQTGMVKAKGIMGSEKAREDKGNRYFGHGKIPY